MKRGCPGSHRVERSAQPRLIALWIVPNYVKEPDLAARTREVGQLNILQTVVPTDTRRVGKEYMVKPHG